LRPATHWGEALQFFLYDTPKVLLLLTGIVFVMGMVNSYFTPERTRALLAGGGEGVANVMAASLGHRHALLLLLGGAAVHRLRAGRRAAGRDLLVPDRRADGQRGALALLFGLFGWKIARSIWAWGSGGDRRRLGHRPLKMERTWRTGCATCPR
jgi:hypothetical protein